MSAIKTIGKLAAVIVAVIAPALGQNQWQPVPAASGTAFRASVGYTSVTMAFNGAGHANLNGINGSASLDFSPRWGGTLDATYARASDVVGTPHPAYLASLLAGPAFYPFDHRSSRVFLHALVGAGAVDGALPKSATEYRHGYVVGPSYAFGGGFEHPMFGPLTMRIAADYLRTSFIDTAGVIQPQNNLRLSLGFVFPSHRRSF